MIFHRSCSLKPLATLLYTTTSRCTYTTQTANKVNKSALTELRQKTGFSFFQCNQALKSNDNDVRMAEDWLNKQAEVEGWTKAAKLQKRATKQGLVAVFAQDNYASLVQVACETDFVARNELFHQLVSDVAKSALEFRRKVIAQNLAVNSSGSSDIGHLREVLIAHKINGLGIPGRDETVEENLVQVVRKMGENMQVKKALAISTHHNNVIGVASHGGCTANVDGCAMGMYSAVVVLRPLQQQQQQQQQQQLSQLARSLSQHVIGMNPKVIQHSTNGDVPVEDCLLSQEFLLDDTKIVGDLVAEAGVEVVDFVRYAMTDE